jgi:hypothetical protein
MAYAQCRLELIGTPGGPSYSGLHAGSQGVPMSFALYLIGFVVLIGGIAWGLVLAGVPSTYIAIACVILVGIGIISGVARTRSKDPSS